MNKENKNWGILLLVVLRVIGIVLGLFFAMFAFDTETFVGFLVKLIPALLILIGVSLSWISPKYSGLAFIVLGLVSILFSNTYQDVVSFLIISVPLVVVGVLFYIALHLGVEKKIVKSKK